MIYDVIFINGKDIAFEADDVEEEDGTYKFRLEGELIGAFEKRNIAGYVKIGEWDDEWEDEDE